MKKYEGVRELFLGLALALLVGTQCLAQPDRTPSQDELDFRARADNFLRELPALMQSWREAQDPAAKKELAGKVFEGIRYGQSDVSGNSVGQALEELVAGGPVAEKEVKVSTAPKEFRLKPLKVFTEILDPMARNDRGNAVWLDRRISPDALEVWSSKDGWLFDGKGKLLNHAVVPRRDGTGLQWFGAFLPDGQWVTTDLWSYDQTLYLYSKSGEFLRELSMVDLSDPGAEEVALIGWARSDKEGKGWVFNRVYWTGPDLKPRKIGPLEAWALCMPRQLGVRYLTVPSDDGQLLLSGHEAGHGNEVGYPTYYLNRLDPAKPLPEYVDEATESRLCAVRIPGHARNLGFWPGSHNVYIFGDSATGLGPIIWFLDETGKGLGWMGGKHLADAADGQGMLFKVYGDLIANVGNDMKCREVRKYVGAGGAAVAAYALYDDLNMGLFIEDGKLELCAWE